MTNYTSREKVALLRHFFVLLIAPLFLSGCAANKVIDVEGLESHTVTIQAFGVFNSIYSRSSFKSSGTPTFKIRDLTSWISFTDDSGNVWQVNGESSLEPDEKLEVRQFVEKLARSVEQHRPPKVDVKTQVTLNFVPDTKSFSESKLKLFRSTAPLTLFLPYSPNDTYREILLDGFTTVTHEFFHIYEQVSARDGLSKSQFHEEALASMFEICVTADVFDLEQPPESQNLPAWFTAESTSTADDEKKLDALRSLAAGDAVSLSVAGYATARYFLSTVNVTLEIVCDDIFIYRSDSDYLKLVSNLIP